MKQPKCILKITFKNIEVFKLLLTKLHLIQHHLVCLKGKPETFEKPLRRVERPKCPSVVCPPQQLVFRSTPAVNIGQRVPEVNDGRHVNKFFLPVLNLLLVGGLGL